MSGDGESKSGNTRNSGSLAATQAVTPAEAAEMAGGKPVDSHADTIADTGEREAAAAAAESRDASSTLDDLVGTTLQNRYEISRKIGQGGMGAVYEAVHISLRKKVAVKVLLDKYAAKDTVVARLEQEARLASSIGHDHIVDITDFGETVTGRTFVVMEFLEGESLGSLLSREGPISPARAIRIARQAASALGAAHKKGIIHRDVKPENIFLRRRDGKDSVKVVDFGISKTMRPEDSPEASPRLTQTGMVLGTPLYMSPEQARGDEDPDHRVDVYSLGVILYEAVTGEVPFRGTNYLNIVSQVISSDPKAPRELRPDLSVDFEEVILKALAKEPEERYQTMEELDADLAILQGQDGMNSTAARITASRRRRKARRGGMAKLAKWVGGIAVTGALVVIAILMTTNRGEEKKETGAAVPPPAADAAPVVVKPDAQVKPKWDFAEVEIVSKPPGADIYEGNVHIGKTPHTVKLVVSDRVTQYMLELDGYDYGIANVHPLLHADKPVRVDLKKAKRGKGKRINKKEPKKGGKRGSAGHDDGGGDIASPYNKK